MIIYNYYEDISLQELNALTNEGWEVQFIKDSDPNKLDVWLRFGYSDYMDSPKRYTLIKNIETGAEFYLDKTFSYGDAIIITFFTIFFFAYLGKIIFNYFFYNE